MIVAKKVSFDAAHYLPNYEGKCKNVHGHHWEVEVAVEGLLNEETGMVIDFKLLKDMLEDVVVKPYDHTLLNSQIVNPTAEHLAALIWDSLSITFMEMEAKMKLKWIKVWETKDSYVELRENLDLVGAHEEVYHRR